MAYPTIALPFRFAGNQVVYLDSASDEAVGQEIQVIAATGRLERTLAPGAGVPDPTHSAVDMSAINAALALWGRPGVTVVDIDTTRVGQYEIDDITFER